MTALSVIIPVYNICEVYLRKCIESIIEQSLKDIEIIIVDDGSTDDSGLLCDEYASKDDRINVIHQDNKGLSGARNTGVYYAKSEWVTFVDGDDFLEKECLENAYRIANEKKVDMVMWGIVRDYNGKLEPYDYDKNFVSGKIYNGLEISRIRDLLLHYDSHIATAYSKIIKKSILVENNIYHDEVLRQGAEGIEFNYRLFGCINSLVFLNMHWYHYTYNELSISAMVTEKNTKYVIACFESIRKQIDDNDIERIKWFYNRFSYVVMTTTISGIFHPKNQLTYKEKKMKLNEFLKLVIVRDTYKYMCYDGLSIKRKILLKIIKLKCYRTLSFLAKKRYSEKMR